jgi:superfamily II DNA or RNA helicase
VKSELRPYQREAVDAFLAAGKGILSIHSGAGKTIVGCAVIETLMNRATVENTPRAMGMFWTIVITPTVDLVNQWEKVLKEQGILNVNVVTYALAARMNEKGSPENFDDYSLFVLDEVHHLSNPGAWQRLLVPIFKSPYALGLTATPPTDPENILLRTLPILYTRTLGEGTDEGFAAPVEVRPVPVKLTDSERKEYARLTDMIRLAGPPPQAYTRLVGHDPETGEKLFGGQVMTQRKQLVAMAQGKFDALVELVATIMDQDNPTRILIWSEYLEALYEAKRCLDRLAEARDDPRITSEVVTGKTPKEERKRLFAEWGHTFRILLAARVAEEGINVPEVAHGVILAGARTSRQNLQRIGRLLRPQPNKVAKLWLVFGSLTIEEKLLKMIDAVTDV